MDTDFHYLTDKQNLGTIINPDKPINIGNYVWIGCRSTVLKGAVITDGSVIAACSIVTKELQNKDSVYVGNRCIKENVMRID